MTSRPLLHNIVDPSEWPLPVEEIAQVLARPLPTYLATGPYPSVSATASSLLRELSESPWLRITREDSLNSEEKPLTDVFDIVLSTVSELRELINFTDHGYSLPTIPIWSTLIKTLGYVCSDDILILGEVPFILPRLASSEQCESSTLDGTATVLLSYVVHKVENSEIHPLTSEMDIDCQSVSSRPSDNQVDDDDISMDYMEQPRSNASTTRSIDLPFDAHVLPGRGRRFCAILPLLCVTDEENMTSLLSSVLYQRHVWGIIEPVVGIIFSKSGTVGQVVLGWIDSESIDDDNLPAVNIARSISDSICNPSLGVFDLTDPGLVFLFAQFILGLNTHFHAVMRATSNPEIRILDWRSDHIAIDNRKMDGEQWRSRVEHWARGIMSDDSSEDSSLPDTPSPQAPPLIFPVSPSTSMPPHTRSSASKHGKEGKPSRTSQGPKAAQLERPDVDERAIVKLIPEAKSALSSSSFGNRSAQGLADSASISTWLFDRNVWTIAAIELGSDAENATEINEMINVYHSMTKLLWPPEWKSLDALPRVDNALEHLRKQLFDQYNEICEKAESTPVGDLNPSHTAIFRDRFSALMGAVIGAFTLEARASGHPVYEAEVRHDWDAVLYRFLVADGEGISPNILFERTLRFPRNNAADSTDSHKLLLSQRDAADTYLGHCGAAQHAAYVLHFDRPTHRQTLAALNQANSFVEQLKSLGATELSRLIEERTTVEPRTGTCDAIFVTPVSLGDGPGILKAKEHLKRLSLVQYPDSVPQNPDPVPKKMQKPDDPPPAAQSHLSPKTASSIPSHLPKTLSSEDKQLLRNPFAALSDESTLSSSVKAPEGFVTFQPNEFLLSGFVVEYKRRNDNEMKALNQVRMYLVSAVRHLSMLGIRRFGVFGLGTSGYKGGILMAWSDLNDNIYMIERNICMFDLSSPIGAFQFASFLIRMRVYTETLKHLFNENEKKEKFLKEAEDGTLLKWTKLAQIEAGPKNEAVTGSVKGLPAIVVSGMVKDR